LSKKDEIGTLIGKTRRALVNRINQEFSNAGYSITMEQWKTLTMLDVEDCKCQKNLAEILAKDKTSLTRMVNGLEKKRLVKRSTDQDDRRHKLVKLTKNGLSLREELNSIITKIGKISEIGIESQQKEICKNVLIKIYRNLIHS
jgi:DNA-binding MarR family transcriptional regulator